MPECPHHQCHENFTTEIADKVPREKFNALRDCVAKKTPKSWLWIGFCALLVAIPAWSEITNVRDRYVTKDEIAKHITNIARCNDATDHLVKTVDEIKANQRETRRDVKEILKILAK